MKNKPNPALSGDSYLLNEIKKGHQILMRLTLDLGTHTRFCLDFVRIFGLKILMLLFGGFSFRYTIKF
jgi:hypothetical protein